MLALLGLLMMGCCLLSACSASVENTPEGVATFVVNSYMKGKYPDTRDGVSVRWARMCRITKT